MPALLIFWYQVNNQRENYVGTRLYAWFIYWIMWYILGNLLNLSDTRFMQL